MNSEQHSTAHQTEQIDNRRKPEFDETKSRIEQMQTGNSLRALRQKLVKSPKKEQKRSSFWPFTN